VSSRSFVNVYKEALFDLATGEGDARARATTLIHLFDLMRAADSKFKAPQDWAFKHPNRTEEGVGVAIISLAMNRLLGF
jgi:hypothetical protein